MPANDVNDFRAHHEAPCPSPPSPKGSAFWLSYTAILVATLLSALDVTAVSTTLPTITADLNGADTFVWVGSAYALSSTAILPLSGSLANIFGRKPIMLICIAFFALARTVQGIGGGGILNLTEIIISDLVPLAERGLYQGVFSLVWALASGIGPPIVSHNDSSSWVLQSSTSYVSINAGRRARAKGLLEMVVLGNFIVVAGATLAISGLTFAGIRFPWSSAQVLAPLISGLVILVVFIVYEMKVPVEPTIPWEVLNNRAALSGYLSTFAQGIVGVTIIYYLPVYFQASMGASPIRSGVEILPTAMILSPFALIAGVSVQILGKYRLVNIIGWVLLTVGLGVMSLLKADSSTGQWVGYQILTAAGTGLLYASVVFPILARQTVENYAAALAFFAFVRSFSLTWGVTISSTVLQNELKKKLPAAFLSQFPDGLEIAYAAIPIIGDLQEPLRTEVRVAFAESMSVIWKTMIGISALGFISLLFLQEIKMALHTDATYGLTVNETSDMQDQEKAIHDGAAVVTVVPGGAVDIISSDLES
ncbi:hypothetical protein EUX98_g5826 [Antrodiella citrinella]|uniref:Major facilitator superfamily (MFS) profile domain-containing protein n=1 Tax=Antrodiella citrinella TaxID=2447956 RepID=A0A4S4MQM8_9APHY|nr:hypothetical protein EUX98_g5826 [Antrodiella citrinella]